MKKIILAIVVVLFTTLSFAQTKANWKEMHDFHAVMSKTFHPAEENNMQPLKESAAELTLKAKNWQSSTVPEGYDGEIAKPILAKLVKQCAAIETAVKKKKKDAELKKMITEAHDIFHELMEKCRKGDEE
jgi:hypothetical protein